MAEAQVPNEPSERPTVRHERSDVEFRWVLAVILVAICLGSADLYVIWAFFREREQDQQAANASRYPLAPQPATELPAGTRLEQLDRLSKPGDSSAYRKELSDQRMLGRYGSTSDEGYIRIPIERAMELVIGELRVRKKTDTPETAKADGLLDAGESNSGRMFQRQP